MSKQLPEQDKLLPARLRMLVAANNVTMTVGKFLQVALDEIEAQTGSTVGFYHFLEADQETISLQNWSTNTLRQMCVTVEADSHYSIATAGVWVDCIHERRPVIHNDYASLPHRKGMPPGHVPIIREMLIPIFRGGRIMAVMGMGNKPTDYDSGDVEMASLLGDFSWEIVERKGAEEALLRGKQEWERTFDSLPDLIMILDNQNRILRLNRAMAKRLGMRPEECIGLRCFECVHGLTNVADYCPHAQTIKDGREHIAEVKEPHLGGDFLISTTPLFDKEGRITGTVHVARNITDQKQAEVALRHNHELLNMAQEIAQLGSWELDLVNNRLFWSDEVYRIFGLQPKDFCGTYEAFLESVHPEDRIAVDTAYSGSLREGRDTYAIEHRIVRKSSGEIRFVHERCKHFRDESGHIIRSVGMVHDITEQKQMEEEVHKSHLLLEKRVQERTAEVYRQAELLDLAHDAIIVRDMENRIIFWNKGATEMYGWTQDEAKGKILHHLLNTQFPVSQEEIVAKIKLEGRWEGELIHIRKDGKKISVLSRAALKRDEEGRPTAVMLINLDITERVKVEEQLRHAQRMEALGTLAGGISHDLNNLLMPIMINTDLALLDIQEGNVPSAQHLRLVKESAKRGRELVKQIITFSRQKEQPRKALEITPILKETLKFLRSTIPSTITIQDHVEPDSSPIMADPTQIHQVLMNLCSNSAHAMREEGGILEITLDRMRVDDQMADKKNLKAGPHLRLTIRDTGRGMKPEVKERAFDPFFTTKRSGEGTGMGLAVVHGIVKNHDGAIYLESEEGKGTTVTVFFPVFQGAPEEREILSLEPFPAGVEKILLIDDEEIQVISLQSMLERFGYQVVAKTDPREALEIFRLSPNEFDLVITDQVMPELSGDRLARELLSIRPDTPIILCTGLSETVDEEDAKAIGIRDFVLKPFSVEEVAKIIKRALSKT